MHPHFWINLIGLSLLIIIIWWFLYRKKSTPKIMEEDAIEIEVANGIYIPSTIHIPKDKEITLRFIRYDASPCAETVTFPDLGISKELVLNEPNDIQLKVDREGEFDFTCAMGMYRGKLVVTGIAEA